MHISKISYEESFLGICIISSEQKTETWRKSTTMEIKVFIVILLLLILTSDGTGFGRKRSAKCQKGNEQTLSRNEQNSTSDYYYYCDPTEFGVVQKIPYLRSCSPCDMIEIDFSSACIRCGMCLAIAEKVDPFSPVSIILVLSIRVFFKYKYRCFTIIYFVNDII